MRRAARQLPTRRGEARSRRSAIVERYESLPVRGFSDGTFSISTVSGQRAFTPVDSRAAGRGDRDMDDRERLRQATELWQEASRYQREGDLDRAIEVYQRSIDVFPTAEATRSGGGP
jgi:hypothetical protein